MEAEVNILLLIFWATVVGAMFDAGTYRD